MAAKADIQFDIRPVDPLDEKAVAEFSRLHVAAFEAQSENGWAMRSVQASLESPWYKGVSFYCRRCSCWCADGPHCL